MTTVNGVGSNAPKFMYQTEQQVSNQIGNQATDNQSYASEPIFSNGNTAGANIVSGCSDGSNNGKLNGGEFVANAGWGVIKNLWNGVKNIFSSPGNFIKTAAVVGACFIPVVGPFIGAGLATYGVVKGASSVYNNYKAYKNATTDDEAKLAAQGIGGGAFETVISAVGVKASVSSIKNVLSASKTTAISSLDDAAATAASKAENASNTAKAALDSLDDASGAAAKATAKAAEAKAKILENASTKAAAKAEAAHAGKIKFGDNLKASFKDAYKGEGTNYSQYVAESMEKAGRTTANGFDNIRAIAKTGYDGTKANMHSVYESAKHKLENAKNKITGKETAETVSQKAEINKANKDLASNRAKMKELQKQISKAQGDPVKVQELQKQLDSLNAENVRIGKEADTKIQEMTNRQKQLEQNKARIEENNAKIEQQKLEKQQAIQEKQAISAKAQEDIKGISKKLDDIAQSEQAAAQGQTTNRKLTQTEKFRARQAAADKAASEGYTRDSSTAAGKKAIEAQQQANAEGAKANPKTDLEQMQVRHQESIDTIAKEVKTLEQNVASLDKKIVNTDKLTGKIEQVKSDISKVKAQKYSSTLEKQQAINELAKELEPLQAQIEQANNLRGQLSDLSLANSQILNSSAYKASAVATNLKSAAAGSLPGAVTQEEWLTLQANNASQALGAAQSQGWITPELQGYQLGNHDEQMALLYSQMNALDAA